MITTEAKRTDNSAIEDLDVIVVGAGFAGLYLLDRLRSTGMAVRVFEAGGGLPRRRLPLRDHRSRIC
jgi:cation diffusion facilitator CzcD-associated flavoprotein CzcO